MQNTKLIQLLKTLTQAEFKKFKDFVNSPFYNKNKNVIALFDYLKKNYPDFSGNNVKDEDVFRKLFPDEKYDYFKLKNIISDLLALGKDFLATDYFINKTDVKEKFLLEEFRDRNLDSMFEQLHKTALKKLNSSAVRDEFYYLKNFELSEELKTFYSPKKPNSHFNLFQDQLDHFLDYSLIKILRIYNTMLHENKQNNYNFDLKMFDEVFSYLKKNADNSNPTVMLYFNIINLEKGNDKKYFFILKDLFGKKYEEISFYDKYMYYLHMSGFCADRFNIKCKTDFMREHFLLAKDNLEKGTINLGKILYMDFMNYVKIAARVDEYDWAEEYIDRFKNSISEEHRQGCLNYCYGYINYRKGNLEKSLDLLSQVNFSNFIIKIQVKNLLLMITYELGYYEQAVSLIDTFRHYLMREKNLLPDYRESFTDYLRITGDMIKLNSDINKSEYDYFKKKIINDTEKIRYNQFGIKLWLKEKIKEL